MRAGDADFTQWLLLSLALHGALLAGTWGRTSSAPLPPPLHIKLAAPPRPPPQPPPAKAVMPAWTPPPPSRASRLPATQAAAAAPPLTITPTDASVAVAAAATPSATSTPGPSTPVQIDDLALNCPDRPPPDYPVLSKKRGESGHVVLRVELDEHGGVASAQLESGSGFERLDRAALAAVRSWRCQPPRRDGRAIRAVARQPFDFVL